MCTYRTFILYGSGHPVGIIPDTAGSLSMTGKQPATSVSGTL